MRPELVKEAWIPLSGDGLLNAPLGGEGRNFPDGQEPGQPQGRDTSGAHWLPVPSSLWQLCPRMIPSAGPSGLPYLITAGMAPWLVLTGFLSSSWWTVHPEHPFQEFPEHRSLSLPQGLCWASCLTRLSWDRLGLQVSAWSHATTAPEHPKWGARSWAQHSQARHHQFRGWNWPRVGGWMAMAQGFWSRGWWGVVGMVLDQSGCLIQKGQPVCSLSWVLSCRNIS